MCRNIGNVDRIARAILGLALLSLAFVGPQSPWGYLGLLGLVTAALGYCPHYTVLGFHTYPTPGADPIEPSIGSRERK